MNKVQTMWDAYYAAMAADDAFQRELVRQFEDAAGDYRYGSPKYFDDATLEAMYAKLEADRAHHAAIDAYRAA